MEHEQSRTGLSKLILTNQSPIRLRAFWRLLLQTIMMIMIGIIANIGLTAIFKNITMGKMFVNEGVLFIAITGSVFLAKKILDKESISNLGLLRNKSALPDMLIGLGISFLMMAFIFFSLFGFGWLKIEQFAWESNSLFSIIVNPILGVIMFIMVVWNEELLSRGYHLQTISNSTNRFWGVLLSSSFFSVIHLLNPNHENKIMAVVGILLAGFFLSFAYFRSNQLWLPIGLHIGWNFFQGIVFGFPVSGMNVFHLVDTQLTGPTLLTGGTFGPESGIIIVPAIILGSVLVYLYTRKHQQNTMSSNQESQSI
jgi:uncharacterized protein